jgi:tetratricopeptide (TPR) repeat protein
VRWRSLIIGLAIAGAVALFVVGARSIQNRRFRAELDEAAREIESGRLNTARNRLERLSASRPGDAEVNYRLGVCEQSAGRLDAALSAWQRVSAGTPFSARAGLALARALMLERGRFSDAETVLKTAIDGDGPAAFGARQMLAWLFLWQGRTAEARTLLQNGWDRAPDRPALLRELWQIDNEFVLPVESIQASLDQAARLAPNDDRAWLGRANLLTISGRFDEAESWIDACLRMRPHDPVVWRARLNWAMAAGQPEKAESTLVYLPADHTSRAELYSILAWFASEQGDREAERTALSRLIELVPGDTQTLDRLAALAVEAGDPDAADDLRRRRQEAQQAKERYREFLGGPSPAGREPELARLAETLGRAFDARGWWTLAVGREPRNRQFVQALAKAERRQSGLTRLSRPSAAVTLADLLSPADRIAPITPAATPSRSFGAPPAFDDRAETVGLNFIHESGRTPSHQLPETMAGGIGVLDYDGDGWLDVYAVQGGVFPPDPGSLLCNDRLFRNLGDGTFEDVTRASGIGGMKGGYGHGVTVGDYDNDGRPDLFVTRWRSYALYRNKGNAAFEDVTERAGLGGDRDWPTSAAFADLDDDGDLDLFVCHYVRWDTDHPKLCRSAKGREPFEYCEPLELIASRDHLFRNDGGRFMDVTADAGVIDAGGRGLGVVATDFDGDRHVDLFVANDMTANALYRNLGGLRFREVALEAGVAGNADGGFQAGMGIACADLEGDGRPDLAVTNFYGQSSTFFHNLGDGLFCDRTTAVNLAAPSRFLLGFGIALFDFNNDSQLDLSTANGHVNDNRPYLPYAMPAQLLAGAGDRFLDVSRAAGDCWTIPRVGRGLASGDLDNDGRVDLLIVSQNGPLAFFHNRTKGGHFVTFLLEGAQANRDAVGTGVSVTSGGRRRVAWRIGGGSYLSASDPRLHFGLGQSIRVETVEILWPSGKKDRYFDLPADTGYVLREGATSPTPLVGFRARNPRKP